MTKIRTKPSIPQFLTWLLIALVCLAVFMKLFELLSIHGDEEKTALQYRTCGVDDLPEQLRSARSDKFVLVVVGDGVKDQTLATTRPYSSNYAQGWDLYEGVAHAAKKGPFSEISQFIELIYVDDGGDSRCANLISEEIIKSPRVIGVIGHASTGTTKIALENYKQANIPTIIPIATNPYLTIDCKNCFRLPSNDAIQAKAIADYAVNVLKGENIYLVWDDSDSAKDYSEFLESEVVNLIGSKIRFRQPITFRPMNYEYLLKSISYNNTDVLIFCGYGSMAREFLNGLRFEYVGKENLLKKPKVILSDGARISDIKEVSSIFGFQTYLSFPSDKLKSKEQFADFVAETPPREQEKMKSEESYEIFGYDALAMFSIAFKRAIQTGNVSRKALNESLANQTSPNGDLCYTYKFENGENVDSRYFIYSLDSDSIERRYDGAYLNNVFTDKPVANLIASYDDVTRIDTTLMDTLRAQLLSNPKAKGEITLTCASSTDYATEYARRFLTYLIHDHRIEPARITFVISVGTKDQTQIWVVPPGAAFPPVPENHTSVRGEDILKNSRHSISK